MKVLIKIHDPNKVNVPLTLKLPPEKWKVLENQCVRYSWVFPSMVIRDGKSLTDLIIKAQESFESVKEINK